MKMGFPKKGVVDFFKKHREKTTLGAAILVFIVLIVGGFSLQKKYRTGKEIQPDVVPKTVELKLQPKKEIDGQSSQVEQSAHFSLKPSPDELLQQLTSLENFNEDVLVAKYKGLRVLWPGYFFNLQLIEGGSKATLVLDVAEDGFGVLLESEIDTSLHPLLRELESGSKLWIGGEILAVDRSGTGTVYLRTEHLGLGDEMLPAANNQQTK